MEVEIEDLHLQIDDIAKAKTAVRNRGVQAGLRENRAATAAAFAPNRDPSPARSLHARTSCRESRPSPLPPPPLTAEAPTVGEVKGSQPGLLSLCNHLPVRAWLQTRTPLIKAAHVAEGCKQVPRDQQKHR